MEELRKKQQFHSAKVSAINTFFLSGNFEVEYNDICESIKFTKV